MKPPGTLTHYYADLAAERLARDARLPHEYELLVAEAREAQARRALATSEAAWLKAKADLEALLDEIDAL